jgi:hypothetical protein
MQKHSEALDEALLSNCFAFIKKASDDGIQEVVYALQKVLQLYAAQQLGKADAKTDEDASLTRILTADETEWDKLVEQLATSGAVPIFNRILHSFAFMASRYIEDASSVLNYLHKSVE